MNVQTATPTSIDLAKIKGRRALIDEFNVADDGTLVIPANISRR